MQRAGESGQNSALTHAGACVREALNGISRVFRRMRLPPGIDWQRRVLARGRSLAGQIGPGTVVSPTFDDRPRPGLAEV